MSKKSVTQVVGTIVDELTDLTSEERHRVLRAALALLGESAWKQGVGDEPGEVSSGEISHLPIRARTWMKQSELSLDQLGQVFHIEGDAVEVIASEVPGKTNREKVRNAYVLVGVAQLLLRGEPKFTDQAGRDLCETLGFYDSTNHAKYMKGNEFTGSREKGWTLTAPGLKVAAGLIKQITKEA